MREEIRRAFDEATEAPHPAFRSALRARLEAGPAGRPRVWQMTLAAGLVAGLLALAFVAGINLLPRGGHPAPGPAAAVSPSPSASAVASPSPSPTATPAVTATDVPQTCLTSSGGSSTSGADVTDVRVGTSAGYDRFVIQFDGPVPSYSITSQPSPAFMQDPTGHTLTLQGSTGIKIVVRGASGTDLNGHRTFTGSQDLKPGYPMLKEARQTGDFERVFGWGLGVSNPGCLKITLLTGPDRLVVDLQQP